MSQIPIWKRLVKRAADQLNGTMLVSDAVTLLTAKDERIAFLEAENKRLDRRHVEFMVEGGPVVMKAEYDALEAQVSALEETVKRLSKPVEAARALADAMETCHQCKGMVLVEEQPTNCEDCSWDCDNHEGAECPTIYGLHLELKRQLRSDSHKGDAQTQKVHASLAESTGEKE